MWIGSACAPLRFHFQNHFAGVVIRLNRYFSIPLALLVITLIGAGFRFSHIGEQPLWLDEGFSVWMALNPIPEIIRLTIDVDQHPPLYPILLHFWVRIAGSSEAGARSLSALLGVLTILPVYFLGKTLSGKTAGLLAALILAISPFHVQYAQEARSYTFLAFFACVSMWMTARLLIDPNAYSLRIGAQVKDAFTVRRKGTPRDSEAQGQPWWRSIQTDLIWLVYMISTALAVYGHNTAILLPIAINLFVLGLMLLRRFSPTSVGQLSAPSLKNWILAQVGVFLLWSPWMAAFYVQALGISDEFWIPKPTLDTVSTAMKNFLMAFLPQRIDWQWLVWLGFTAAFALAWRKFQTRAGHFMFLAVLFLAPFGGELLISLRSPIFAERTLIWATIPLYVLLAVGISHLRHKPYIVTASLVLVTLAWLSISNYYTYYEKERWDLAAKYVSENLQKGDVILFNAGWTQIPFDYYFAPNNHDVEEYGVPATLFERGELEPRMTRADIPRLQSIIHGRERVWLVYSHYWWTDPEYIISKSIGQQMRLLESKTYTGMQIRLYGVP